MIDTSSANTRQEKVKIITDKLEQGIKDLMNSDRYKEYLSKMSKLHRYSFSNTVLILSQCPNATMVAGFNSWKTNFGRTVNKGTHGISILVPAPYKKEIEAKIFDDNGKPVIGKDGKEVTEKRVVQVQAFKPAYVYDISQTSGKPVPRLGVDELTGTVENYDKIFEAIKEVAPVNISFEKITDGAKGYYSHTDKRIAINEGMSELQNLKTLVHETAHSMLRDNDYLKSTGKPKDRKTKEVEAESVSYTVCSYLGLDTSEYSFGYISGWAGERKLDAVKESMETIRKTSSDIISAIERHLHPEMSLDIAEAQQQTKHRAIAV